MNDMTPPHIPSRDEDVSVARDVLQTESAALQNLSECLGSDFSAAVDLIVGCSGYVIVTGVGKSGHIGRKIAATLASTGTPSFFVHPTEASHGDLGMINRDAVIIAISNSGETGELRDVLIYAMREDVDVIAITAREKSFLGQRSTTQLILPKAEEACPNGLAPTSSTTMTLALGDALAVAAMKRRNFTPEDFGARHPGGSLGLGLQRITEWIALQTLVPNPSVKDDTPFVDVLRAISDGRCGAVSIVDETGQLKGVVTDGDVRRAVSEHASPQSLTAKDILVPDPITVAKTLRMSSVVEIFQTQRISQVVVTDASKPIAIIHVKDLMQGGYF